MEEGDDELLNTLKALREGIIASQGQAGAALGLARELMLDFARLQPDPVAYVTALHDRVSQRLDPLRPGGATESGSLSRDVIDALFRVAAARLQREKDPPASERPRRS